LEVWPTTATVRIFEVSTGIEALQIFFGSG
jgi:hypothetical protein